MSTPTTTPETAAKLAELHEIADELRQLAHQRAKP